MNPEARDLLNQLQEEYGRAFRKKVGYWIAKGYPPSRAVRITKRKMRIE